MTAIAVDPANNQIILAGVAFANTVTNPAPGGGTTGPTNFTINNPSPMITPPLSPSNAIAGGAAFTLTVNGTNFVATSQVSFNGGLKPTTFKSATQLTAAILATDIATAGFVNVTVTNPGPGGGTSTAAQFTINNPQPVINTLSPANTLAGGVAFTLTVNGSNFVSGAKVDFGSDKGLIPTSVTAARIKLTVPASDVATAGNVNVTVSNPAPGGGVSTPAFVFTVDGFTVAGPGAATTVKAGVTAMIPIKVTPTANGFTSTTPISFTVSGLPAHTTATFNPPTANPGTTVTTVTLMIATKARGAAPPSAPVDTPVSPLLRVLPVLWLATMLAGLYAMKLVRRTPQWRRYAAVVPLALLLVTGAVVAGCAGAAGTPAGTSQLTVTATSGTLSQTTPANSVTLTVQ